MIVGGDGDATGDGVDLMSWVDAAERAAVHLAARPAELATRPLDRASCTAISTAMLVRGLHDEAIRGRISRRIADLRRACAAGTVGLGGGSSPSWTSEPGAQDRGLLLAVLGALRDEAAATGAVPMGEDARADADAVGARAAHALCDVFNEAGMEGVDDAIGGLSHQAAQSALRTFPRAHLRLVRELEDRKREDGDFGAARPG